MQFKAKLTADYKISLYVRGHVKIIPWKFHVPNPTVLELFTRKVCGLLVYKLTQTIECVKK